MSKQSNQRYRKEIEKQNLGSTNKQEILSDRLSNDKNKINREFTDITDKSNQ